MQLKLPEEDFDTKHTPSEVVLETYREVSGFFVKLARNASASNFFPDAQQDFIRDSDRRSIAPFNKHQTQDAWKMKREETMNMGHQRTAISRWT